MLQLKFVLANPFTAVYDGSTNSVDPFLPELWANESLAILEENMVVASLVHRDFEPEFSQYGKIVHTRRPGQFTSYRKTPQDDVTIQNATATDVPVPLNQQLHVSFLIRDGEESKSFKDLIETYMAPAMLAQARALDRIVLGQLQNFLPNAYGGLRQMTSNNARTNILGIRNLMNINKAYVEDRNMVLTPNAETTLLGLDIFTQAQQVGDDGTALREAWLGRKYGFDMYMAQNAPSVAAGQTTTVAGTINAASGYAKSATALTVSGFAAAIANGTWVTISGDDSPQRVVSSVGGATPTQITIIPGLRAPVSNGAVVTSYSPAGTVNGSSFIAGYADEIVLSSVAGLQVGQMVSFGTSASNAIYSIISIDTTNVAITLDRPLDVSINNNDNVNVGPAGEYCFAFHRNCLALVVRPLAMPRAGTGALSAVVNHNDLSMRATITYNGTMQGHLVTLDFLCGVAVLDTNLGAVLLG